MFVLCVLYSKEQKGKSQDNQDKEVQLKYLKKNRCGRDFPQLATPASYKMDTGYPSRE